VVLIKNAGNDSFIAFSPKKKTAGFFEDFQINPCGFLIFLFSDHTDTSLSRTCICQFSYKYRKFLDMPMRIIIFDFATVVSKLMSLSCRF